MRLRSALTTFAVTGTAVLAVLLGGAAPAAAAGTEDPIRIAGDCYINDNYCGTVTNYTDRYIKMQYSQDGETKYGYVTPHTTWGGNGKDMDYFLVPRGCVITSSVDGERFPGGSSGEGRWHRGELVDNGWEKLGRITC